jgi:hypothetical protein
MKLADEILEDEPYAPVHGRFDVQRKERDRADVRTGLAQSQ